MTYDMTSVQRILVLCFVFIGANFVVAQSGPQCPRNWSYFTKSNICLQIFGLGSDGIFPLTWSKAEEYCMRFSGGHLASCSSEEEVTFIVKLAHSTGYDDGAWAAIHFGLFYSVSSGWTHPDGSSVSYLRWYNSSVDALPQEYPYGKLFTRQQGAGFMWRETGVDPHPFVCQANPMSIGK